MATDEKREDETTATPDSREAEKDERGDAGVEAQGEEREGEEFVRVPKKEFLSLKQQREEMNNQLRRERDEATERLRRYEDGSATPAAQMTAADREAQELQAEYQQLQEEARDFRGADGKVYPGSASAKITLRLLSKRIQENQEIRDELYLNEATTIDDETGQERPLTRAEKAAAKKFKEENARQFGSMAAALDAMEGQLSRKARLTAAQTRRQAEQVIEDRERKDVVRTARRDETPAEARDRVMTSSAYQKRLDKLEEAGDVEGAWKLKADVAKGRVTLSD